MHYDSWNTTLNVCLVKHINTNSYWKAYPAPWASNKICFKDDNGMVGGNDNLWSTVTLGINWFDIRGHEMIYAQGMQ